MTRLLRWILPHLECDLKVVSRPFPYSTCPELSSLEILVVLLEDRRFFQHRGIDWRSWIRELWKMITFRRFGGASTIDMQYVRTRTGYRKHSLRRKMYEMTLAHLLQKQLDKLAILRGYVEIAYFGTRMYGAKAAAKRVFNKEAFDLSESEAALIAAMLVYPKPSKCSPAWQAKVERRSQYGLRLLRRFGSRYIQLSDRRL